MISAASFLDAFCGEVEAFVPETMTIFLALMSSTGPRTVRVPLSFLGAGDYRATLVRDNLVDTAAVRIENATVNSGNTLTIEMREGGGFVGRFTKK